MQKSVLQVPIDKSLKSSAEKAASEQGFSSLQEIVRVFLAKLAANKIEIGFKEGVNLSSQNEKRYLEMTKDFKSKKDVFSARNVDALISKLDGN
ncbi:MAG: hypothetical protein Q7S88_00845 [Candidatus Daviesbacteria bacterium]|nr:hypothetical protein [Candidatus Daviesbacteria bacterium]